MQWLLTCYTMDFNRRHGAPGHLFQGRFKAIVVEAQGYFATLSRYIHLNPVRGKVMGRGEIEELRERLRAYRWSSYRGYAGLGSVADWVREEETFGELGLEGRKDRRVRYRRFVESDLVRGRAIH
jgi:putative transposase